MNGTLLCETVTGRTMAELLAARDAAVTGDMVELRLDGVANVDLAGALAGRSRPALVTCRPRWEGGRFDGGEEERLGLLARALDLGSEFIDVEWRARFEDLVARDPARVVVSTHDFEGVPGDLDERVRAMRRTGAATIKVAVMVSRLAQTLRLQAIGRDGGAVVIGMGPAGLPTRLLPSRFGSRWTYAGQEAPGQIPAARMVDDFGFRRHGPSTTIYGVVSTTATHSLSPVMHNAAFEAAGIDGVYLPFQTDDFADFLEFGDAIGVAGASVTVPFKLDALRAADSADDVARRVGAANTLRRHARGWEATNTDVDGFLEPLREAVGAPVEGLRAVVLGAGGSARAVALALANEGARVTVCARSAEQARTLATEIGVAAGAATPAPGSWDLLVNCTPLGGAARRRESPLPGGPFTGRLVYDLTYGEGDSLLLEEARRAGCRVLDGLPMLVAQAERQFEWWTGRRPATGVMAGAARRRLDATRPTLARATG